VQRIVGQPGVHEHELRPIEKQLIRYVQQTAGLCEVDFPDRSNLPDKMQESLVIARKHFENYRSRHKNQFPKVKVHGDFTPLNILREGENAWLTDFERSFEASGYFDFVYAWATKHDPNLDSLQVRINEISKTFYGENTFLDQESLDIALALFVFDIVRFLEQHRDSKIEMDYALYLLKRVRKILI